MYKTKMVNDNRTYPCHYCEQYKEIFKGDITIPEWLENEREASGTSRDSYVFYVKRLYGVDRICAFHLTSNHPYKDGRVCERNFPDMDNQYEKNEYICKCNGKKYIGMRNYFAHIETLCHLTFLDTLFPPLTEEELKNEYISQQQSEESRKETINRVQFDEARLSRVDDISTLP